MSALRQSGSSPAEYEEIIGSSLEECGRISRIIDSLLFLARAENPQTQVEREPFDVGQELANIREFFDASAQEAGVHLDVIAEGEVRGGTEPGIIISAPPWAI